MKKIIALTIFFVTLISFLAILPNVLAVSDNHTAREEAEGEIVWGKLQKEEITCEDLPDDGFGALGEYFMGQTVGDSHEAMNEMMIRMLGEEGEQAMHVVMGKRFSGCELGAVYAGAGMDIMPMMQMMMPYFAGGANTGGGMMGSWSNPVSQRSNFINPMMNFGYGFGLLGWIWTIVWWALVIAGVVAIVQWMAGRSKTRSGGEKTPLDILKERYARGEISKEEFEAKKKDITD
jgi:putative membrane protein